MENRTSARPPKTRSDRPGRRGLLPPRAWYAASTTGNIESTNDADWFRVTLTVGHIYQFDLEGSDTGEGTLSDPFMVLLNSSGNQIASDFDSGAGLNARITYAPTTNGTY